MYVRYVSLRYAATRPDCRSWADVELPLRALGPCGGVHACIAPGEPGKNAWSAARGGRLGIFRHCYRLLLGADVGPSMIDGVCRLWQSGLIKLAIGGRVGVLWRGHGVGTRR